MKTILLLTASNIFMTFAWYGHLRFKQTALWKVVLVSWLIAFAEYCFQVPANRIGSGYFSLPQLKVIQEVVTMVVFAVFAVLYMGVPITRNYLYAGLCLVAAASCNGSDHTAPPGPPPVTHLEFRTQPRDAEAGVPFPAVEVVLRDDTRLKVSRGYREKRHAAVQEIGRIRPIG